MNRTRLAGAALRAVQAPPSWPMPFELFERLQSGAGAVAHRGGTPENTIEAMRHAHENGAVAVEGVSHSLNFIFCMYHFSAQVEMCELVISN